MNDTLSLYPEWMRDAPCAEVGPDAFFPMEDEGAGSASRAAGAAMAFCQSTCPVMDECLLWALQHDSTHGVFGGTSGRQRRDILSGTRKLPEWCDERHEEAVREHQEQTGADAGESGNGDVTNFAASLAARTSRRLSLVERTQELTDLGHTVPQIAEMLGTTDRTITKYRAQAREMRAA